MILHHWQCHVASTGDVLVNAPGARLKHSFATLKLQDCFFQYFFLFAFWILDVIFFVLFSRFFFVQSSPHIFPMVRLELKKDARKSVSEIKHTWALTIKKFRVKHEVVLSNGVYINKTVTRYNFSRRTFIFSTKSFTKKLSENSLLLQDSVELTLSYWFKDNRRQKRTGMKFSR